MPRLVHLAIATIALLAVSAIGHAQDTKPGLNDKAGAATAILGHVFVSGDVQRGGSIDLIAGQPLTLTKAILRAGGVTEWGNLNKVQITRQTPDGHTQKLTVNLRTIMKSGDPKLDPVLQDGDRIFVPKHFIGP